MIQKKIAIIAPWVSDTDWSETLLNNFLELLIDHAEVKIIYGQTSKDVPSKFHFLEQKLTTSLNILHEAEFMAHCTACIILDGNFINFRVLRTLLPESAQIVLMVNGGAFQPYDFDHQFLPKHVDAITRYEEGLFGLCDKIIASSHYAKNLLIKSFPLLRKRVEVIPYPLKTWPSSQLLANCPIAGKQGTGYIGRQSWEKGIDLFNQIKPCHSPSLIQGLTGDAYFKALASLRAVVCPARAELFGYGVIEAIQSGTIPLVPNGLSYVETVKLPQSLFLSFPINENTVDEIHQKLKMIECFDAKTYQQIINNAQENVRQMEQLSRRKFKVLAERL